MRTQVTRNNKRIKYTSVPFAPFYSACTVQHTISTWDQHLHKCTDHTNKRLQLITYHQLAPINTPNNLAYGIKLVHEYTKPSSYSQLFQSHSSCAHAAVNRKFCPMFTLPFCSSTAGAVNRWVQPHLSSTTPMRHAPHPCTNKVNLFKPTHLDRQRATHMAPTKSMILKCENEATNTPRMNTGRPILTLNSFINIFY